MRRAAAPISPACGPGAGKPRRAQESLKEVTDLAVGLHEMKTLMGQVTCKVAQLLLLAQAPQEAAAMFAQHLATFGKRRGRAAELFQHTRWLAEQHIMFARVLADAMQGGLAGSASLHPGTHLFRAAELLLQRFKALELGSVQGGLETAQWLEVGRPHRPTSVTARELELAVATEKMEKNLAVSRKVFRDGL